MRLGIVYHMPFWQAADGSVWEAEGSFARYVDSLAPYFDEVVLSVPVFDSPQASGSRVRAANVRLAPLPYFPGPRQFYPALPTIHPRLRAFVADCDVIHLRVPTPAGVFVYRLARRMGKATFVLVVGDYRALRPHLPYRGLKRALFAAYVAFEERALAWMTKSALTFANGAALAAKHARGGTRVHETRTTTLSLDDIGTRQDTCQSAPIRLLTVSRIDPRKGLRVLPAVIAALAASGTDATIDLVGPTIGQIGDEERTAILQQAQRLGVAERVALRGAIPLDALLRTYHDYDLFVLPTGPGEGIPRVLLEAMAAGLPVITTDVAGIGSLVRDQDNGLLVDASSPDDLARAVRLLIETPSLRRQLIQRGYETARAHTLERQAAEMMGVVSDQLRVTLARVPKVA
ncbi:MAG: glycosyltransferase family 4 protein [Acidobacteriota bacterium]